MPYTLSFNLHSPVSSNSYKFQTAHLLSSPVFLTPLPPILFPFSLPLSHFINPISHPGFHPNYSTHFWPILPSLIHFLDTLFSSYHQPKPLLSVVFLYKKMLQFTTAPGSLLALLICITSQASWVFEFVVLVS